MKCATRKLRSPLKYHGGKAYLARRIIALFPPHDTYIEPFSGGGSVLLNKPPCPLEIAGDFNEPLIETWKTLRDCGPEVLRELAEIPYTESSWKHACRTVSTTFDAIKSATAFIVRNRMSRGGLGKDFAWSDRLRGGQPGDVNAWQTMLRDDLPTAIERIRSIVFYHKSALDLIRGWGNGPNTLIYADPPYLHETRTHRTSYGLHEMTREDHVKLLAALNACKASVFLSGYRSELYDDSLRGWTRHEFEIANHSGQGKTKGRRVECVWEKV